MRALLEEKALIESVKHDLCVYALAGREIYRDGDDKKRFMDFNNEVADAILAYFSPKEGGRVPLARVYECLLSHGVVTSKQAVSRAIEAAGPGPLYRSQKGQGKGSCGHSDKVTFHPPTTILSVSPCRLKGRGPRASL